MSGGPKSRRQVWLEREIGRIGREVSKLVDENVSLAQEFEMTNGSPTSRVSRNSQSKSSLVSGQVVSPDQIKVGVQQHEAPGMKEASEAKEIEEQTTELMRGKSDQKLARFNTLSTMGWSAIAKGSALSFSRPIRLGVYLAAAVGVVAVLVATSVAVHDEHVQAEGLSEHHASGATASPLMRNIAVSLVGCGLMALLCQLLAQPLILGYLLGGVLVGPIGLGIVESHVEIAELSSLGLIFLLFMIGLELDVKALLKMGKVVLLTGLAQFPICAGIQIGLFMALSATGLSFGTGPYATMYVGMVCGISSTMIVVKLLGEKGEMDTQPGRLTIGILIFQDIWAIVVLAIQPNLASPEIVGILKTFGMIFVLIVIAMTYAKFVMPAMLYHTSRNLELMLIMSLSWCFFIGCTAILPFVGLSMELASLIAGVALATFPYSAEFNGKIKYIRDFFITLFFAGLGMQIPVPSIGAILMGALVALVVVIFRWVGIFAMVFGLGGGSKLGAIACLNLSQISEFALVICSLGMGFGHINEDTMTIIIWTFSILAISSSYVIGYNMAIYDKAASLGRRLRGKVDVDKEQSGHGDDHDDHRDIVMLGYHKIAFMMIAEIKAKSPQLLKKIHVIDFNEAIMPKLRDIGLSCSYGDISCPDVLEHAFHGDPKIVISTIPDSALRGINNEGLVKVAKQVWPDCHIIVTADNPEQARRMYKAGADYVVRMAKLCAERLYDLLFKFETQAFGGGELEDIFNFYKQGDKLLKSQTAFVGGM